MDMARARKALKALIGRDAVRHTLTYSIWTMHGIITTLVLAVIFGDYTPSTLTVIASMFTATLTAIGSSLLILVGDRVGKNLTSADNTSDQSQPTKE